LAQLQHVVNAVFVVLHMAVEHGSVRAQPEPVRSTRRLQPLPAIDLVVADDVAHAVGEDLRSAAGHRVDTGILQLHQHFGKPSLRPRTRARKYSSGRSGCRPPTMWNSVTAS